MCCSTRVRRRRRRPLRKIRLRLNRLLIRVLGKPNYERFRENAGCAEFGARKGDSSRNLVLASTWFHFHPFPLSH